MGGSPVIQNAANNIASASPIALIKGELVDKPKKEAEKLAAKQGAAMAAQQAAMQQNETRLEETKDRAVVRNKSLAAAKGKSGRSGTLLTSPLGVVDGVQPGQGAKTLLGM